MNASRSRTRWAALVGLALATTASAQPEQWLQYHTSREGRGYHYLDLTTNLPPNVALPKLKSPPHFARWVTPMDPAGGRWICLDRTRKAGLYDRLFFDSNGNGRLDDDPPVDASRRDQYYAYFDALKVVFKGDDGPVTYHLGLRYMQFDDGDVRLLAQSQGWYEGTVTVAGKKRHIQLIDANVNGAFNDLAVSARDGDSIALGDEKTAKEDEDSEDAARSLGQLLELEGQYFQIEVARDGAFVKIKKAENLSLGQVRLPSAISELVAIGENGHFVRQPTNGSMTLPVGRYNVRTWTIDRKDNKGVAWKLQGYSYSEAAEFEVVAAQPTSLEVGEPLWGALQASESKSGIAFSLHLQGRFGESVEIMRGKERPRAPQLILAGHEGSYRSTNTFEYG